MNVELLLYRRGRTAVSDGRSRKMTGEDTIVRKDGPLRSIRSMIARSSENPPSERTAHETAHGTQHVSTHGTPYVRCPDYPEPCAEFPAACRADSRSVASFRRVS